MVIITKLRQTQYFTTTKKVFTSIADQYAKKPIVSDSWQLYNNNGQAITDRQKLIIEIEKFE